MKYIIFSAFLFFSISGEAQKQKNYLLEINGDTISISLDELVVLKTRTGQSLNINLKQKEILTFADETLSFQYPSIFTLSSKIIEDGVEQILVISADGNAFLIQRYKNINPESVVDLMMEEITEESKDAGYKETTKDVSQLLKSGKILIGKQSTLELDDEKNNYTIYPLKIKKGGILIVLMQIDPQDENAQKLYDMLWKTLETKN
jgi:3-isopropylmalate dehydratase small subunit